MNKASITTLPDRAVILISGKDAGSLLQALVSVDMDRLEHQPVIFGALLAPQGKILFDFFIHKSADGFLFDIDRDRVSDFSRRMMMYKLRSDVSIVDVSADHHVVVHWGDAENTSPDPRLSILGSRFITTAKPQETATPHDYHQHRASLGVPEAGKDFAYDAIFPHDAMMDAVNGINFSKGCYIGQEIVSRVQHRSTARKRFFIATSPDLLPDGNEPVMRGDKSIGALGISYGKISLALLRTDKLDPDGDNLTVSGQAITIEKPGYFAAFQKQTD